MVELNGDWRDEAEIGGRDDKNTGGHLLYVSPGIRGSFGKGWSCSVSVGFPVVEDLNGAQSEPELRLLTGIAKSL